MYNVYQRLPATDPDSNVPNASNSSLRPLTLLLVIGLGMSFVVGIYFMTKSQSNTYTAIINTTETVSPLSSTESTIESEEEVTKPAPKVNKNLKRKFKIPDRVVLEDKYFKITDCSE